ncbi:MAG TPA: winged helix-turn-helix domain-containing protein [Ideonella sp.]|uniref:ATP-binding protein n=1 Tax=Ideonella sp. TaxID=1929293 RepID=UPI002B81F46C|nr:winged helix-turn-helix domain-containing protein [Ideonella sp.]HSI50262.1 winged helix-turn-helix domain-containing protein [Ideonella sp.]
MAPTEPAASPVAAPLRFGPAERFELQPAERRLLVDGEPVALGRRALDLLVVLAAQPDHLLTKNELLDRVWPGLVVEEANLQMQISKLRKVLGGEIIATVPGRGYRFTAAVRNADAATAPAPSPASPPPTLAAAIRLIGRDEDLARVEALLLRGGGCVTLVGSSGVGKTSLARAAAARSPRRIAWVDLAALTKGGQVADAVARALELQLSGSDEGAAQLVAALQGQALLLVLDNAEHLVQTCAELATLLRPLGDTLLLVTSQVPLAVAGEQVLRLEPLALPGPESSIAGPGQDALALLVERIVAADHRFVATPAQLPLLRAICTQLDGLPLALEMVAARVPLLGLQGVHDALAERFALLTRGHRDAAPRHRTLHNALEWSYRLLGTAEQRLFRALGVFAGGFTLELAVALMTDDGGARWDVIDGLAALADRSLVVVGNEDPPRYRLLETMRAFALEQLAQSTAPVDEEGTARRRHAGALQALFAGYTPGDTTARARCVAEMVNAREAIAWASEHDLGTAAQLTTSVTSITTFTAWRHESGNWLLALESLMEQAAGLALPAPVQAAWWTERARVGSIRRDTSALAAARRAVALWSPLQQPRQSLIAKLIFVRSISRAGPELEQACADLRAQAAAIPDLPLRQRFLVQGALTRAAGIRHDMAALLAGREAEATLARQLGDQDAVDAAESDMLNALCGLARHAEAVQRGHVLLARVDADGSGRNGNLPWVISPLLVALLALNQLDEARALLPRAFAAGHRFATPAMWPQFCSLAVAEQRWPAAAQLLGYTRQCYDVRGMQFEPGEEGSMQRAEASAAAALGPEQLQAWMRHGRTLDDVAAEALAAGAMP